MTDNRAFDVSDDVENLINSEEHNDYEENHQSMA